MGGAILGGRSNSTHGVLALKNQWHDFLQHMEHRTTKEILSLVLSFRFCFLFSLFRCDEEDGKVMTDCVGG
jgi:hypothetical protein